MIEVALLRSAPLKACGLDLGILEPRIRSTGNETGRRQRKLRIQLVREEPVVRVLERISALAASGIAILFSSHDPDHAFLCARRVLLLAEGRVLETGTPREVIRPDTLERMYRVSVQVVALPGGAHTCLPAIRP